MIRLFENQRAVISGRIGGLILLPIGLTIGCASGHAIHGAPVPSAEALLNSSNTLDRERGIDMTMNYLPANLKGKLVDLAMNDPVPGVEERAAVALGINGDDTLLRKYLDEPGLFKGSPESVGRRRSVANVAYYLKSPASLGVLCDLAGDPDLEIRQTVYVGLSKSPSTDAIRVLSRRNGEEVDPYGKRALNEAIREWKRRSSLRVAGRRSGG